MPDTGRRSSVAQPKHYRPRTKLLSPIERYQRARLIAEMRARERPVSWRDVAHEVGMSESAAKAAYADFLEWEEPQHDPLEAVQATIDALTVTMHEAFRNAELAKKGSSARVASLKLGMDAALHLLQVLRAAGRAPRSLAAPSVAQATQVMFREFAELLRRHNVGDEALEELLMLAESQMGRLVVVNSQARLAGVENSDG